MQIDQRRRLEINEDQIEIQEIILLNNEQVYIGRASRNLPNWSRINKIPTRNISAGVVIIIKYPPLET